MVSAIHTGRREDLANKEVVRRAPIGVDPLEQVWRESVRIHCFAGSVRDRE
jgi:hypothetical protein